MSKQNNIVIVLFRMYVCIKSYWKVLLNRSNIDFVTITTNTIFLRNTCTAVFMWNELEISN